MPCERQFVSRGEDSQPVVGGLGCGLQHERRLREVRPGGDALHLFIAEAVRAQHDGDGVPEQRAGGEGVYLLEFETRHCYLLVVEETTAGSGCPSSYAAKGGLEPEQPSPQPQRWSLRYVRGRGPCARSHSWPPRSLRCRSSGRPVRASGLRIPSSPPG